MSKPLTLPVDGEPVAAAQEERFTRKKHDARFPRHAIEYCLAEGGAWIDTGDPAANSLGNQLRAII